MKPIVTMMNDLPDPLSYGDRVASRSLVKLLIDPATGRLLDVSEAAAEFYGDSREGLRQGSVWDLTPGCPREETWVWLVAVAAGQDTSPRLDSRHRLQCGEWREVMVYPERVEQAGRVLILATVIDVTELRQMRAWWRQSEERFHEIAETVSEVLWISSPDGQTIQYISPAFERLWGISCAAVYARPSLWFDCIDPDDHARVLPANAALTTGTAYDEEYRIHRPDGERRWIHDRGYPVYDDRGTLIRLIGIAADITERKQAELARQESETRFRTLFEASSDAQVIFGEDGWLDCNATATALFGCTSREELLGRHPADFSPPTQPGGVASRVRAAELIKHAIRKGHHRFEWRHRRLDGTEFDAQIQATGLHLQGQPVVHGVIRDITEQRRLHAALAQSEERLRLATAGADLGTWYWDMETQTHEWSERCRAHMGLPAGQEPSLEHAYRAIHPEDRPRVDALIQRALEQRSDYAAEYRIIGSDGRLHWLSAMGRVHTDPAGRPRGMSGITQDITPRKEAEQNLRESERRYRELNAALERTVEERTAEVRAAHAALLEREESLKFVLEGSRLGTWDWNLMTGEVRRNDYWAEMLGYTRQEVDDATAGGWLALIHPDDRERVRQSIEDHLAGRTSRHEVEYRMRARDGRDRWILDRARIVRRNAAGRAVRMSGTHEDITERKVAGDRLAQSEARFRELFDYSPVAYQSLDATGRYLDVNQELCALLGYARDELLGRSFGDLWAPDTTAQFPPIFHRFKCQGATSGELELVRRDGTRVTVLLEGSIQRGPDDRLLRTHCILYDITERKRRERELDEARQSANAANLAKSAFLAHMSHEIRTPLNSVLGLVQVLEKTTLDPDQRTMLEQVLTAGRSLLGILNDILELSKIEAGQLPLEARPFGLVPLLADLGSLLGSTASGKGLGLDLAPPPDLDGGLVGDPQRLEQVLVNLIGNAIKFTDRGTVRVQVTPLERTAATVRLRFAVHDTGIGIAPDILPRLFTPFTQGDGSITRRFGGTGLGLAICKRLIEGMGGAIGAESRAGAGSTFWFEVPFQRTAAEPPRAPVPAAAPAGPRLAGLHLLVVDDSAMNREVIARMLTLEGASAILAGDGQAAVDQLRNPASGIDAVLMDVQMPVMDGLTATRLIRGELALAELPVIACTAGVLPEERERAHAAGVNDFLSKPVDLEQLVAVVARWVPGGPSGGSHPVGGDRPSPPSMAPLTRLPIIPGIDPARLALLSQGDEAVVRPLLRGLVADLSGVDRQVQDALEQGARAHAAGYLHRLRGAAANLGAIDLADRAQALEHAIQAQSPEVIDRMVEFTGCLETLLQAIQAWLAGSEPAQAGPATPPGAAAPLDAAKLAELRHALATHRPRPARRLFAELEASLIQAYGPVAIQTLTEAMTAWRYDEAIEVLDALSTDGGQGAPL